MSAATLVGRTLKTGFLKLLGETLPVLVEEVVLSVCEQIDRRESLLGDNGLPGLFGDPFLLHPGGGEKSYFSEGRRVLTDDICGLHGTGRESGDEMVFLVRGDAVMFANEVVHPRKSVFKIASAQDGIIEDVAEHVRAFLRFEFVRDVAVGHDHDHRADKPLSEHVVHHLPNAPLFEPGGLVTADAVEEEEDGERRVER